jgi:hypothetical protein
MTSTTLKHVHDTHVTTETEELSPPHPPRTETPRYRAAHHQLVVVEDRPCTVCGVRQSTLHDPTQNPFKARALETHHYPIERSLVDACDWRKVAAVYPAVTGPEALMEWVDSPDNLLVLCDVHHRSLSMGIHHLVVQDWMIQRFLLAGYRVAASKKEAAAVERADEMIIQQAEQEGVLSAALVEGENDAHLA